MGDRVLDTTLLETQEIVIEETMEVSVETELDTTMPTEAESAVEITVVKIIVEETTEPTVEKTVENAPEETELIATQPEEVCMADIYSTIIDRGTCGENLEWVLNNNWVLTIFGSGAMNFPKSCELVWYEHMIREVVMENGITSIASSAFSD